MVMSSKVKVTCLWLEHLLKSLFEHLSLDNYLCLKGYPYTMLPVKILLLGGATMKGSFQMWYFWPSKLLASQGHKLKQKEYLVLLEY
jgi:hypothetical protein